ncbi:hypothetical protein B0H11DRAFT_279722 [Mycena galericulata]|nr:hypothetical protein B0H11DRAFT_279722 [Mycena galericulata]
MFRFVTSACIAKLDRARVGRRVQLVLFLLYSAPPSQCWHGTKRPSKPFFAGGIIFSEPAIYLDLLLAPGGYRDAGCGVTIRECTSDRSYRCARRDDAGRARARRFPLALPALSSPPSSSVPRYRHGSVPALCTRSPPSYRHVSS